MKNNNITGILLAGGKSSRMGTDKGLLNISGKNFVEHIIAAIVPNVKDIIIIANNNNYNNLGFKVYEDIVKECGPLGGIYTGLINSKTERNIVVSCDIPFVNSALIKYIIENSDGADITIPIFKGNTQPLCAVYNKRMANKIHGLLMANELKIHDVLKYFVTKEICITKSQNFYTDRLLANINTPEELKQQIEFSL